MLTGDQVANAMMEEIKATPKDENGREAQINSIYMMSHSGARGSPAQMKQLAGMRGLMAKPSGEIIETPIISNFKEGLTVLEYFNSTHGARKGLADTALKTANSGYLTRRLVDVAQDSIITERDCGTDKGITVQAVIESGEVLVSLGRRVLGRTTATDVKDPATGKVIIKRGHEIQEEDVERIEAAGVQQMLIRSVLTCDTRNGVCGSCYGRDLARGTPVNMGEAVGVIAAQSIGEPGTQLTMRTFHIGGAAARGKIEQSSIENRSEGIVRVENTKLTKKRDGTVVVMNRHGLIKVFEYSAQDGEPINVVEIPVDLQADEQPDGETTQFIVYFLRDEEVAAVHRARRPRSARHWPISTTRTGSSGVESHTRGSPETPRARRARAAGGGVHPAGRRHLRAYLPAEGL